MMRELLSTFLNALLSAPAGKVRRGPLTSHQVSDPRPSLRFTRAGQQSPPRLQWSASTTSS
ncbi:hypothetical protein BN11_430016 [Nostocoides australiense Ben110]|uniref:Uncharacterized protein n=1 Tax=Nostocoides australiense Ben110 TaxID=1193182 RepID=W6K013_9MICO|nr:hypothetical protein BN11_430016 [Tetrasphaera australiensis Ben110]